MLNWKFDERTMYRRNSFPSAVCFVVCLSLTHSADVVLVVRCGAVRCRNGRRKEWAFQGIAWGFPALQVMLAAASGVLGNADGGVGWCMVHGMWWRMRCDGMGWDV